MTVSFTPLTTQKSRLYIIENRAGPSNVPEFITFGFADSVTSPSGAVDRINVSSPDRAGKYLEIGTMQSPPDRSTVDLTAKLSQNSASKFLELKRKGCPFDILIITGSCRDLKNPNDYEKIFYLPNAQATEWNTTALGAFDSDDSVAETLPTSTGEPFELLPLSYASRGSDIITNQLLDVIVSDIASCGDCDDISDGCQKIFAITLNAGGSPGTPADVVFSLDKGVTWLAHDIDSLSGNPSAIAEVSTYIVVTSNADGSIEIALKSEFAADTDPSFSTVTTGFVTGGEPNDIWSLGTTAFIVGDGGYVYLLTEPTAGVTVIDAGVAVQDNLNAVHAISEDFAVAVGNAGSIIRTTTGSIWSSITSPVGVGVNFNAIWIQNEKLWFIGGDDGVLYYTKDGGTTWSTKTFPGSGSGVIYDISFSNENVGYLAHTTTAPLGRILETIDGGNSWIVAPRAVGTLPANDQITALATCIEDENFVIGVGLADDAADGFILLGED